MAVPDNNVAQKLFMLQAAQRDGMVELKIIACIGCNMSPPRIPVDSRTDFSIDWYQVMEAAQKTYGDNWRSQITPEELRAIDEGLNAEANWASYAQGYDLPGPRRIGVIDD